MTTNIRVAHRGGNKKVRVYIEGKNADGEWVRAESSFADVATIGQEMERAVYENQRLVVEEYGEFQTPENAQ